MNKDCLEHEEWSLTLTHSYIDKDGIKIKLEDPITLSVIQPSGIITNINSGIYDRLLYEMGRYLKNKLRLEND